MSKNNKKLLELLSSQLLFAAQNIDESDTDSDHEALIDQLGTYGQVCPECGESEPLQDAADDWTFDFVYNIAHNKDLLGLFAYCAYHHLSKQDVEKEFRKAERSFCVDADKGQMHFHLTGEHHEDCCCPKCEGLMGSRKSLAAGLVADPEPECLCEECQELVLEEVAA
ncbi:hypothetical protein OAF52_02670 [bacterium]|nr:hypothetical protein [bacterium]